MLDNITEPQLIWCRSGEVPVYQIVVHGRAGPAVLAALLSERTPPTVGRTDPPAGALGHWPPDVGGLSHQEPVAELRVVAVSIEQGVGSMCLEVLSVGDGVGQPAVVGLAGELEDPTRHRHGDTVGGELFHERVKSFPGRLECDKYAAARRSTSFSCSSNRLRRRSSRSSADSLVALPGVAPSSISA